MRPLRAVLVTISLLGSTLPAFAAARLTYSLNGAPTAVIWPQSSFPIPYEVDRRAAAALGEPLIARSFAAWAAVPEAEVSFRSLGVVDGGKAGQDKQNTVSLLDGLYDGQGFIAVTTNWYDATGKMTEADIQVDSNVTGTGYNVQQVLEHEIGHLLGLDHSAVLSSVMYPYVSRGSEPPELDSDDKVAIAGFYPKTDPALAGGTLTGRVVGNEGGIFAAQVVAVNEEGAPVATSLTNESGDFVLQALPAGNYRVYAEPLDGPVDPRNLDGVWRTAKVTSFKTQFVGGAPVAVRIGTVQGNLVVSSSGAPVQLNPKWIGISTKGDGDFTLSSMPVAVRPGDTVSIAVAGDGFTSGMTTFDVLTPGVKRISEFHYAANFAYATFSIDPSVNTGSSIIRVTSGNESAMLTGALRIDASTGGRVRTVRK